jgi:hypothetical protein
METISAMTAPSRRAISLPIAPQFRDHHFEGRTILPAVEALSLMADAAEAIRPGVARHSRDADFRSFLAIPPEAQAIEALLDAAPGADGGVRVELLSRIQSGGGIGRVKTHVAATFAPAPRLTMLPIDAVCSLEGPAFAVPAARLYGELVPFGPAYHNAVDPIWLSPDGAVGAVASPPSPARCGPLGSPYPLDAAFHLACAWSQRYAGLVAFPVGYAARFVVSPTRPGETYFCRVAPRGAAGGIVIFDLWLFRPDGSPAEAAFGVRMADVSKGRAIVPQWVLSGDGARPAAPLPEPWREHCAGQAMLELAAVTPLADGALSAHEAALAAGLGEKRRKSFVAARMAMKRLARKVVGGAAALAASALDTVLSDDRRPGVSGPGLAHDLHFAAAHDDRFVIAVAGKRRLGVDVERIADKMLRTMRLYMSEAEQRLAHDSPLGVLPAAARVWTLKETAAKALDLPLVEACAAAQIVEIGESRSLVRIGEPTWRADHAVIDDHIFTLLTLP